MDRFRNKRSHNPEGYLYQNWLENDTSPCNWTGITCGFVEEEGALERVTGININGKGLEGPFFSELSLLTALASLTLTGNRFWGEIPGDLGDCKALKMLNLFNNILEGTPNFTALTNLQSSIFGPLFQSSMGVFPPWFPKFVFTGSVTEDHLNCTNLKAVDLSENDLVGPVWAGDLVLLDLSRNRLLATIPPQIGLLENLETLVLRNANLSSDIPGNLTQCKNLPFLHLSSNNFGGSIQSILGE
ncbi:hypothetical protein SUGI_0267660 [Cryptomeria japonica]|nr:hypothetical protein SUGI_0267660 [Cryptomeria japonica]